MGFGDDVAAGRREALVAIRDVLAERLVDAKPGESAALARQLTEVIRELDSLKEPEGSKVDELAKRRAVRRAAGA